MNETTVAPQEITAEYVWDLFISTGKRHILLTGQRSSGKTTLLSQMFDTALPGTTTRVVKDEAVFCKENTTGREVRIGLYDILHPGVDNKMQPAFYGFAALVIPVIKQCIHAESEWISLDEIGYLEMSYPEYWKVLNSLMDAKHVVAVIRKPDLEVFLSRIPRNDMLLIDLDQAV